jgi:hypothetical protein
MRWSGSRAAIALLVFVLIVGALFTGDRLSQHAKQQEILTAAEQLAAENQGALRKLANYQFGADYACQANNNLQILNKIDPKFPRVRVILPDTIGDKAFFLVFGEYGNCGDKKETLSKEQFIYAASKDARDYLTQVFTGTRTDPRLTVDNDRYKLYYPITIDGKCLVLLLSD